MFPLEASAALAEGARRVLVDLRSVATLPADQREAKLAELDERLQDLRDGVVDGHGLRLDGTIQDPTSGELVWFDVSVVHTTSRSYLKDEAKFSREQRAANAVWKSAALMEAYQGKLDRYALLAAMVERQVLGGRRKAPLILPAVVTTHGEFCPGAVQLQEWLVERYRARLRLEGERDDGEKEDDLITAFRCELRAALLVATAKGTAEMLAVAGRPFLKGGAKGNRADPVARPPVARVASASLPPRTAPPHGQLQLVACDGVTASREAINLSESREASLSPIRLPIDDTGQFIDSPTVPGIDFDFDSQACSPVSPLSLVVCGGFPVVT
jgi:hypothetical protein